MVRAVVASLVVLALAGAAAAAPDPPLPRGSKAQGDRHVSALGFRATVDWYVKQWRRQGVVVRTIGPYRVGGVDLVRFVRDEPTAPWRAVHVYRIAGTTWISVVGAQPPPAPLDAGGSTR